MFLKMFGLLALALQVKTNKQTEYPVALDMYAAPRSRNMHQGRSVESLCIFDMKYSYTRGLKLRKKVPGYTEGPVTYMGQRPFRGEGENQ